MVRRLAGAKRLVSPSCIQTQQWVSKSSAGSGIGLPGLTGREYVASDAGRAFEPAKNGRRLLLDRDQAGDGLSALGDHDLQAMQGNLLQHSQALGFEHAGRHSV